MTTYIPIKFIVSLIMLKLTFYNPQYSSLEHSDPPTINSKQYCWLNCARDILKSFKWNEKNSKKMLSETRYFLCNHSSEWPIHRMRSVLLHCNSFHLIKCNVLFCCLLAPLWLCNVDFSFSFAS